MLCYIVLEKRSDYIEKLVNWSLLSNNKIIIREKSVPCEFKENEYIRFLESKNVSNEIDFGEKTYTRITDEFIFMIDVKNNKFNYKLKENNYIIEDSLESSSLQIDKSIILKYKLDDEEKKIIIQIL